mmetsp:Transcript_459/g.838  ORF Transcript_459/g.838 Transcript_459/m.838 type:complete len:211 (-) Transcript_459:137-769(-)
MLLWLFLQWWHCGIHLRFYHRHHYRHLLLFLRSRHVYVIHNVHYYLFFFFSFFCLFFCLFFCCCLLWLLFWLWLCIDRHIHIHISILIFIRIRMIMIMILNLIICCSCCFRSRGGSGGDVHRGSHFFRLLLLHRLQHIIVHFHLQRRINRVHVQLDLVIVAFAIRNKRLQHIDERIEVVRVEALNTALQLFFLREIQFMHMANVQFVLAQ